MLSTIRAIVNLGANSDSERRNRQFWAINATTLFVLSITLGYVIFYSTYEPPTFWTEALFLASMVIAYQLVFALTSSGKPFAALTVLILIGVVHLGVATWLLGQRAGAHLFLLAIPVVVAICADRRYIWIVWPSALLCASVFLALELFRPEGSMVSLPNWIVTALLAADVFGTILFAALLAYIFQDLVYKAETALEVEKARSEALLYNLLPEEIAARLKLEPEKTIADSLPQVAILFADIVNFTPRSANMRPEEIVEFLNRIFSAFDELAEKHGLEKIKTIGDAYMVAAGMPNPCGDPVHRVAAMALDILQETAALPDGVEVRIGLHAGPAVAGVIGNRKLFYDVWGETVNTASRMESHGEPGRIQVTAAAKAELEDRYAFAPRGSVAVKGMGQVETWWLTGTI